MYVYHTLHIQEYIHIIYTIYSYTYILYMYVYHVFTYVNALFKEICISHITLMRNTNRILRAKHRKYRPKKLFYLIFLGEKTTPLASG